MSDDDTALRDLSEWANEHGLPVATILRLPELVGRDPVVVREICDEIAELGYPFTANDLRARWRA